MFLGIVNLLQSAEIPVSFLIQEVVKFDQVTALNEVLLTVQVNMGHIVLALMRPIILMIDLLL